MKTAISILKRQLQKEIRGDLLFDDYSRGRYSTDASIYQMRPLGVVVPKTIEDAQLAISIAGENGVPILARGGGTSQCGQTVNEALVVDTSKYLDGIGEFDRGTQRIVVEPGIVLDRLNQFLKPHGLWFPVDISTSSQATIGGMVGNNSCGARSVRYGTMRDNVGSIEVFLSDGQSLRFGAEGAETPFSSSSPINKNLQNELISIGRREKKEIDERFPKLMRRVGGYNIDRLVSDKDNLANLADIFVGSEGTLGFFKRIQLVLSPLPQNNVLGVCHFSSFYDAMVATKAIVSLKPTAVELVDQTMISLARKIEIFRDVIGNIVKEDCQSVLLVEFGEPDKDTNLNKLEKLIQLMGDLGYGRNTVPVIDTQEQKAVWEVRKQALNIVMSMKGDGKPISFVEDCAVELDDLPEYTARLNSIFERYGTAGTWYAHASVGTLHVRPILNLKLDSDVRIMRAIAEEAFTMVQEYKGSHSGEHGDGIVRSEFHEKMFGSRIVNAFSDVKNLFDPSNLMNPGKIVAPPKMDDRALFRFSHEYKAEPLKTKFDWTEWGSFLGAVEMCNNNGACRKLFGGSMCPSFRATRDEEHSTRGRANVLRLALSSQLGPKGVLSDGMEKSLQLCVGCKACKRECPTGVDMTRMKTEILHKRVENRGISKRDWLVGYLPRYGPWVSKVPWVANLANTKLGSKLRRYFVGFTDEQNLPQWSRIPFDTYKNASGGQEGPEVVVFADCFNRYFEPHNIQATVDVLTAGGCHVHFANSMDGNRRPLCCGKTFLSVGLIEEAKKEAKRFAQAISYWVDRGVPIVGLEPSCIYTVRDDFKDLIDDDDKNFNQVSLVEEYIVEAQKSGKISLNLRSGAGRKALIHGHCHQKAANSVQSSHEVLKLIPGIDVKEIQSTCCGMAGAFGYQAETYTVSRQIGELDFLPAIRKAPEEAVIVATGTSCRHQAASGALKTTHHPITVLRDFIE